VHGVIGLRARAEHAGGDGVKAGPARLELLGECLLGHGHILSLGVVMRVTSDGRAV